MEIGRVTKDIRGKDAKTGSRIREKGKGSFVALHNLATPEEFENGTVTTSHFRFVFEEISGGEITSLS